jgi:hypothetical protein
MSRELLSDLLSLLRTWGPAGDPPENVVRDLTRCLLVEAGRIVTLVEAHDPRGALELKQLVIAYGLGWGRQTVPQRGDGTNWEGIWDKARIWLEDVVFACICQTSLYLEFGLSIEGYAFREHPEVDRSVAQRLVYWLIHGGCLCPSLFAASEGARCEARAARCLRDHSIVGWVPQRCSFLDFVWQAVKGPMPHHDRKLGHFSPKALVQGMHFWNLHSEVDLQFGNVLVWVCKLDRTANFEGLPCRECLEHGRKGIFDQEAFRTVAPRLLITKEHHGRYFPADYWNCQTCRKRTYADDISFPGTHYYPYHLKTCPKCDNGRGPGAKRSRVYLLAPAERRVSERNWDDGTSPLELTVDESALGSLPTAGLDGSITTAGHPNPLLEKLRSGLRALDPAERRILELRYIEQLTLVEAALVMGLNPSAGRELEKRALKELKRRIDDEL